MTGLSLAKELVSLARNGGVPIREVIKIQEQQRKADKAAEEAAFAGTRSKGKGKGKGQERRPGSAAASTRRRPSNTTGRSTVRSSTPGAERPGSAPMTAGQRRRKIKFDAKTGARETDPLADFKEKLQTAVELKVDLEFCEQPYMRTALWEAAWRNDLELVRLLAASGAKVAHKDHQDRTPLHEAAHYGHMAMIDFLLERGHPIDCVDDCGQTPLFRAVNACRYEAVQKLVRLGASTGHVDNAEVSLKHIAAFQGKPQMAGWLYYRGAHTNHLGVKNRLSDELGWADAIAQSWPPIQCPSDKLPMFDYPFEGRPIHPTGSAEKLRRQRNADMLASSFLGLAASTPSVTTQSLPSAEAPRSRTSMRQFRT